MKTVLFILQIVFLFCWSRSAQAETGVAPLNSSSVSQSPEIDVFTVGRIEFVGLTRSKEEFLRKELQIFSGQRVSDDALEEALQRLRNTNFFVSVDAEVISAENGRSDLRIIVREKWTLTPVLRGGSGGGVDFLVVGLYDLNLFGRGIEAGAQYEQFANAGGVNIWWRQPHFLRPVWRTAVELQSGKRPLFYLNDKTKKYLTPLSQSTRLVLSAQRRFPLFDLGVSVEPLERHLEKEVSDPLPQYPDFGRRHEEGLNAKVYFIFNAVDLYDYMWEGHRFEVTAANLFSAASDVQPYIQTLSLRGTHFWRMTESHNFGLRVHAQWTNGQSLLSLFRMGSLDAVRGLDDGERIGALTWLVNAENRWLAYLSDNVVLQSVVFSDTGNAGKSFKEWPFPVAASAGVGLRLGFRPVARLRLRADYARALSGLRHPQSWVVGMQHYF
jgi:outer membrane protein assembly factor BamA